MTPLRVVAGVIQRGDRYFLQQRHGRRDFPFDWESPGGKVEAGETDKQALARELYEELEWQGADTMHDGVPERIDGSRCDGWIAERALVVPLTLNGRDVEVSLYYVTVTDDWVPKLLDAVGCGWFTLTEMCSLPLIPGNGVFLHELTKLRGWSHPHPMPPRHVVTAATGR